MTRGGDLSTNDRTLSRVLGGASDSNIQFNRLRQLLLRLGFEERVRGSHHIYRKDGVEERINLQRDGSKAKVYQVRQVRAMILRYGYGNED